ncbi:hypothetical protein [Saccharibacillus sp. JS10]|uniref:hypothetical protein n=1 Tax=Saccharibacillus sp. JS10 TaxID=2950552 RepID=UPI00210891C4|nr:hypothetical protein [Saccharibacillus sp. JS10]MCQ4086990.1 hypothetical protein [Saccharibacillus sp. JS10]
MLNKIENFEKIILKYHQNIVHDSGGGQALNFPDFDLFARDYLRFAEEGLNDGSNASLINCVSNLKRAMDCQIDTFFHAINLYKYIHDKNLKFEKKLVFIEDIGLFSSRSLRKLNTIRNKMEHLYEVPKIIEIELYFELVHALVRSLETAITLLEWHSELNFEVFEEVELEEVRIGHIKLHYKPENLGFNIAWKVNNQEEKFKVSIYDHKEFSYIFRVHLLMYQMKGIGSTEYIESKLKYNSC